jgi:hypothetical protein
LPGGASVPAMISSPGARGHHQQPDISLIGGFRAGLRLIVAFGAKPPNVKIIGARSGMAKAQAAGLGLRW